MDPIIMTEDPSKCSPDCMNHMTSPIVFPAEYKGTELEGKRFGFCELFNTYIELDEDSFKPHRRITFKRCEECKNSD